MRKKCGSMFINRAHGGSNGNGRLRKNSGSGDAASSRRLRRW